MEAWNLIQNLPEEDVKQVVAFIKNMKFSIEVGGEQDLEARKMAFQRLDNLNIQVPDDFDYKKELGKEGLPNG